MKSNKLVAVISAFITSLTALFFIAAPHAFAATATWTGGGSDTNMNTAANWGGVAPVAGDDLVFPANITNRTVVNNYVAGTSFNSITFNGAVSTASNYVLSGNDVTVVAGINSSMTTATYLENDLNMNLTLGGPQTIAATTSSLLIGGTVSMGAYAITLNSAQQIYFSGIVSGSGVITKTGAGSILFFTDNTFTGALNVNAGSAQAGSMNALGTSAGGTTIASGASLSLCAGDADKTFTEPLTISGTGVDATTAALNVFPGCGSGSPEHVPFHTYTLSGLVTLGADTVFSGYQINVAITGTYTANGHAFTVLPGSTRTLTLPSGTIVPTIVTTNYAANSPTTSVNANTNNIAIVTGTYGLAIISGGTLKGTGSLGGGISMSAGIIAPGMSPGCLNSGNLTFTGGTYQAELGGKTVCTEYDQLKVTGTVDLGSATTLTASLYGGFKPAAGDSFTIIDNDAADAVSGTFTGLVEGATFNLDGYVMKISYVGGDGNDVVLSVVTVPTVADTGFRLLTSSPIAMIAATALLTASAYVMSKRYATVKIK